MIPRWLSLTLFVAILSPGLLRAQALDPFQTTAPLLRDSSKAPTNHDKDKMYEDIEIMRRILDRKLHGLYPSHTYQAFGMAGMQQGGGGGLGAMGGMRGMQNGMGMAGGMMPVTIPFRSLEGVYLKGQGVVYTATLASLQPAAKAEADSAYKDFLSAAVDRRNTEWDSTRRQVRNEKQEPKRPAASKPPSLSDVLLKVLAENGHHFSQLSENESLTIVLTVHEPCPSPPDAKSGTESTRAETKSSLAVWEREVLALKTASDLALLGDMHLKQAKYGDALVVYQRLLELVKSPKQQAGVRRKMAQCYLGAGQDKEAHAELDKAIALLKTEKESNEKPLPAALRTPALPAKVIVSASKKLLDRSDKITFEEFRKQAQVEILRFGDHR